MKIRSFLITLTLALAAATFDASAQELVVIGGVKYAIHDVAKGETLYSLSRRYGVTVDEIKSANEALAAGLKAGQRIKIPVKSAAEKEQPKVRLHKVVRGETLYSLSKLNDLTVEELRAANPHVRKGLKAGQLIEIPLKRV
ncbi:MAG: LysM peptidoglycan-binding domain-containing protein, partial [Alistipes sp.]|nr:LysM peptidoglycan-binding domain-containing protein [Alistipes sp.]